MSRKTMRPLSAALLAALLLAACGGDRAGAPAGPNDSAGGEALPAPDSHGGPVTGMPDAAPPGSARPVAEAPPPDIEIDLPPPADGGLEPADLPPPAAASDGPGADAAVQVIRDYYSAINRHEYARAYALWSGQGQASGQSAAQFKQGFGDTSGVSVEIGRPGPVDAGAGQRYIEVPVTLLARHVDGSEQRFRGRYVLHRAVVDGASAEQRAWRIQSAELVLVQ